MYDILLARVGLLSVHFWKRRKGRKKTLVKLCVPVELSHFHLFSCAQKHNVPLSPIVFLV